MMQIVLLQNLLLAPRLAEMMLPETMVSEGPSPENKVAIAILAAGRSTRMGRPKQLMNWEGKTLVERAADTALEVDRGPVAIVVGDQRDPIERLLSARPCTIISNDEYNEGIASSVRAAAEHFAESAQIGGILFMNCDQPKLSAEHLRHMCDAALKRRRSIVVTRFGQTFGSPALFSRDYFPELLTLKGDKGAKAVAQNHPDCLLYITFEDAAFDLDTPEDFR